MQVPYADIIKIQIQDVYAKQVKPENVSTSHPLPSPTTFDSILFCIHVISEMFSISTLFLLNPLRSIWNGNQPTTWHIDVLQHAYQDINYIVCMVCAICITLTFSIPNVMKNAWSASTYKYTRIMSMAVGGGGGVNTGRIDLVGSSGE